ncbi:MAG: DUF1289 domain-containing protein [Saccharospirillaceae bacterium]|nr:DUF1289 domain-containing protein [Saccharospirillaceae bacterium]
MSNSSNVNNKNIVSPCINNCQLNKNEICLGCFRSISEITSWGTKSDKQKNGILENCKQRKNNNSL